MNAEFAVSGYEAERRKAQANINNPETMAEAKQYIKMLIKESSGNILKIETLEREAKDLNAKVKEYESFIEELKFLRRKYPKNLSKI